MEPADPDDAYRHCCLPDAFYHGGRYIFARGIAAGQVVSACFALGGKVAAYECGEPPVGSSFVQFDLRFYVVALLFIVFEVELAFFFPPAVVFGKLTQILGHASVQSVPADKTVQASREHEPSGAVLEKYQKLGHSPSFMPSDLSRNWNLQTRALAAAAMIDMGVFFVVLLVGFAYLWKRGDLDWVRAVKGKGG